MSIYSKDLRIFSDAAILAAQANGILLVLDTQRTRKGELRKAVRSLETVGISVLATVMNNADAASRGGQYYNSTYAYR